MIKILDNVKPYNKFFLISCFNQEQAAVYEHYGVDDRWYIANNFLVHKYNRRLHTCSCSLKNLLSEKSIEKLTGIKTISAVSSNDIIKDVIDFIDAGCPVIVFLDSFEMPQKDDAYQKLHISHAVLIYGYDTEKGIFYDIDFKYNNNYTYENKTIPFADVENAYESFERYLRHNKETKSIYAFKKVGEAARFDPSVFQKRYKQFLPIAKASYEEAKAYLEYAHDLCLNEKRLKKNAEKFKDNLIKLKWDKLGQRHQFEYVFSDRALTDTADRIHDNYNFISSVVFKYCFTKKYSRESMEQCAVRIEEIICLEFQILNALREKAAA